MENRSLSCQIVILKYENKLGDRIFRTIFEFGYHKIYMLFAGREVRIGKNCARKAAKIAVNVGELGAVRTRGPYERIRTARARGISQSDSRI